MGSLGGWLLMAYADEREWSYVNGCWEWIGSIEYDPLVRSKLISIPDDVDCITVRWRGRVVNVSVDAVMIFLKQFETV